jgi:hypothetical protein
VIWTSDHDDGLPRAKRELYDSGIKVPMIIRWPAAFRPEGVVPGAVDERLISFVDLGPTILSLAGVAAPATLRGRLAYRNNIDMVRQVTPAPTLSVTAGVLIITPAATGHSLEYRLDGGRWQLYTGPVDVAPTGAIDARAVRYGWKESEIVSGR